jgi:PAS domain S-box-containing protein
MKILLIEDSQPDARLFRELLSELRRPEQGIPEPEVIWADRLTKGLEILAEQKVDIVLLDLSLPDSHGLETLYQTQDCAGAIPIVVLTGNNEEALAIKAVRQGAQDYLLKNEVSGPSLWRATCYAVERARTLARWEESYRILQNLPNALYVYNTRNWKVVYSNRRFASLVGVDENLIFRSGIPMQELVHPEDFAAFKQQRQPSLAANNTEIVASRYRIKTGKQGWQWLQAFESVYVRSNAGLPELMLATAYPIPESMRADEAASQELELLRSITDSLTDSIFAKDVSGHYVYSNAAHRRSIGARTRAEVIGKTDFDFVPEHLAQTLREKEEQILRGARIVADEEEPWISPDGQKRAVRLITRVPLRDKQGRVNGLLAMSRDITAEKQATKAAAAAKASAAACVIEPKVPRKLPPRFFADGKAGARPEAAVRS